MTDTILISIKNTKATTEAGRVIVEEDTETVMAMVMGTENIRVPFFS
jgi:hypothetical protein